MGNFEEQQKKWRKKIYWGKVGTGLVVFSRFALQKCMSLHSLVYFIFLFLFQFMYLLHTATVGARKNIEFQTLEQPWADFRTGFVDTVKYLFENCPCTKR